MNASLLRPGNMGITLRTALWSWGVALATLVIFVAAIIPQQRQIVLEHLESKAHGLAVSLRDVAAGAVVNEDFSSVVDYCKEMLRGDPALDYIVITKNDGFSLINERSGWRSDPNAGAEWRPGQRIVTRGIGRVPLFGRRVYYYSQPFDYSGIEWGWIHVGLSLDTYERSVAAVYKRTLILAAVCVGLSLAASGFYARRLVKPILGLGHVVRKVASGDLGARAQIDRHDELGTLARSVNLMTEALHRRDQILESVQFAAQQFLSTPHWADVIEAVLAKIGQAAGVSRAQVFENRQDGSGTPRGVLRADWMVSALRGRSLDAPPPAVSYERPGLKLWAETMERGEMIFGSASVVSEEGRVVFGSVAVRSFIVIPIRVEGVWWGFLGLDDWVQDRPWTDAERGSLRAAADMLGAAVARQRAQSALVEVKETLEHRVLERTHELQEQVTAREKAHAELAEAQHRLVDASRQAGMAEVATGVLHNVGNVLNSVNVSASIVVDQLRKSKVASLSKVAALLREHLHDMADFIGADPKGKQVPPFIDALAAQLAKEQSLLVTETLHLQQNIEHIKQIVAMQQSYAKVSGTLESLAPSELVEDALRMSSAGLERHQIEVEREFCVVPPVLVDRHKALQILVNLVNNAKHALASRVDGRLLTIRIDLAPGERVRLEVSDNGQGIPRENLTRIFQHGFTTKKTGHGFGLHSGANAAKEMGGSLQAFSAGVGTGATFVLELPLNRKTPQALPPSADHSEKEVRHAA